MNNNKKGISLIVLVITILVIIVLAGAVILTISNNNPLDSAKQANILSDRNSISNAISLYISAKTNTENAGDLTNLVLKGLVDTSAGSWDSDNPQPISANGWKALEMKEPKVTGATWKMNTTGKVFLDYGSNNLPKWAYDESTRVATYDYILGVVPTP